MAAAFDKVLGSNSLGANGTSLAITTTQASTAGATIFVSCYIANTTAAPTCTDDQGNTYVLDRAHVGGGVTGTHLFSKTLAGALASGAVITISWTGSVRANGQAFSATGVGSIDSSATNRTQFNSTTWASNACTTTTAGCFLVCVCTSWGVGSATHTPTATWTDVQAPVNANSSAHLAQYKVGGAAGSETGGGTFGTSQVGGEENSFVVAYAAAPSGPTPPYISATIS